MAAINQSVGLMNDAFFVGRKAILDWLNELLQLNLKKIEETASGAVACQVMDALFPGKVPMQKINWGAKTDYEFVANYKVLQSVFNELKVDKKIEVDRLIRARYQDNLEFMQWLKKFFETNYNDSVGEYDALTRRAKGKGVASFPAAKGGAPARSSAAAPSRTSRPAAVSRPTAAKKTASPDSTVAKEKENRRAANKSGDAERLESELQASSMKVDELSTQVEDLQTANAEMKLQVEGLERERDFYFQKLREVEVLLQSYGGQDRELVRDILKVLYATEDDTTGEAALAAAEAAMAEFDAENGGSEAKEGGMESPSEQQEQQQYDEEY